MGKRTAAVGGELRRERFSSYVVVGRQTPILLLSRVIRAMLLGTIREGLRALVVGALLAWPAPSGPWLPATAVVAGAFVTATMPSVVEAQARARSSGGYSRPGRSSMRTPSFEGGRAAPRTPSTSGGYSRPYGSSPGYTPYTPRRPSIASPSASDRALSRQQSADALARYRTQQAQAQREQMQREQVPRSPPGASITLPGPFGGRPSRGYDYGYGSGWFGDRGWAVPDYAYRTQRSFGLWDGLFLWFLLDNLTRPGYADFFHHHQDDPGYRQWRAEAERLARENAEIRQKLDTLDQQMAQSQGQPRDPDYLPADTPPEVAVASGEDARTPSTSATAGGEEPTGLGLPLILLLVGGGSALLLIRRRQAGHGSAQGGRGGTVDPLRSAGNILRHKLSGEKYTPSHFRVGMTLTLDPTPFILAASTTKVPVPDPGGGNLLVSVQAVGTLETGTTRLTRLYLPDQSSFFQLHLGADGNPDECRFFGRIDEVSPADLAEWAFWLDPAEGMIGWPEFQTKDGKTYPRAWTPGTSRIAPQQLTENLATLSGTRSVQSQAMLYAAPTGAAAPAPETEYILVAAVEADGQAWVEVHAGIDVNPAALSLA
jgi:hypothetical protein